MSIGPRSDGISFRGGKVQWTWCVGEHDLNQSTTSFPSDTYCVFENNLTRWTIIAPDSYNGKLGSATGKHRLLCVVKTPKFDTHHWVKTKWQQQILTDTTIQRWIMLCVETSRRRLVDANGDVCMKRNGQRRVETRVTSPLTHTYTHTSTQPLASLWPN